MAIENPRRHSVDDGRYGPLLPLESHFGIERVFQHAVSVRMENVTAVAVDDAVVRRMLLVLLVVPFPLSDFLQHVISQILQREVGTEHGHRPSLTVVDGYSVSGQQARRNIGRQLRILEVGIHPVGTIALHPRYIPVIFEVIVIHGVDAHHADHVCRIAGGKGHKVFAFLRIIVGYEQQSAADDPRVLLDDALQMVVQPVWIVDVALYLMHVVDVCHKHLRQSALHFPVGPCHHNLKAHLGLVIHVLAHSEIHHTGNDGHHGQYHHHDA